ncbi:MAG TPA: prolyl oligopeptidase family serine peptidase, partial [bacterium]
MKTGFKFLKIKKVSLLTLFLLLIIIISCSKQQQSPQNLIPPKAKKIVQELTIHGDTRIDDYFWLRERDNPEVIEYLTAENAYKDAMLQHTEKLQKKLFKEIVGRIKQTDISVPYKDNGYFYYVRYEEGKEYPIYCRKMESLDAPEQIMLNVNDMAQGYGFYQVVGLSVSEDNNFLAFGVDTVSRRKYTVHFKNLETGEISADEIPNTSGGAVWANDNKTVFYATKDSTLRPFKIFKHILNSDPTEDIEIYHEADNTFNTYVYKSKSKRFIFIVSGSTLSSEYRFLEADAPDGEFQIFNPRERDHEYSIEHFGDKFYIVTNWNAKNFRLMETPVDQTTDVNWKEVIPHRDDVLLEDIEVFKEYLVVGERKEGLRQIRVIDQQDKSEHYLDFGEPAYTAYTSINPEFDTDLLRYGYTSMTTPNSTFDYNMKTKEKTLLKQEDVLGDFDPQNYQTERLYAIAKDSTKIPVSLVYKKDLVKDGNDPLLLYGYGSYGASMDATFSSVRLSLLDRGFVYAIAHIRGGQEMGRQWYEDGKL